MKRITLSLIALVFAFCVQAQSASEKRYALYGVAFYNLENLFDTIHDSSKNDYEYLPEGSMKWGTQKYTAKLKNMSKVLAEL